MVKFWTIGFITLHLLCIYTHIYLPISSLSWANHTEHLCTYIFSHYWTWYWN